MNYRLWTTSFLTLLTVATLSAQTELVFTGRLVDDATGRGAAGVVVRIVGQGEDVTDDDGLFRIPLRPGTSEVQVQLPLGWLMQYPREGRAPVPVSRDTRVNFEVKRLQRENQQLQQEVARLRRQGKLKDAQIDSLQTIVQDSLLAFQQRLNRQAAGFQDSLQRASREAGLLREKVEALTLQLEQTFLKQNRTASYGLVSSELLAFQSRLKDLRDLLPTIQDVFLHPRAAEAFNQAVQHYNAAYNNLNDYHQSRLADVRLYWDNPNLVDELSETYDLMLRDIHQGIILPLNTQVVAYLQAAGAGRMSRVAATKKARKEAKKAHEQLAFPINILERQVGEVNEKLSVHGY